MPFCIDSPCDVSVSWGDVAYVLFGGFILAAGISLFMVAVRGKVGEIDEEQTLSKYR